MRGKCIKIRIKVFVPDMEELSFLFCVAEGELSDNAYIYIHFSLQIFR
jgi:hypothetical protein